MWPRSPHKYLSPSSRTYFFISCALHTFSPLWRPARVAGRATATRMKKRSKKEKKGGGGPGTVSAAPPKQTEQEPRNRWPALRQWAARISCDGYLAAGAARCQSHSKQNGLERHRETAAKLWEGLIPAERQRPRTQHGGSLSAHVRARRGGLIARWNEGRWERESVWERRRVNPATTTRVLTADSLLQHFLSLLTDPQKQKRKAKQSTHMHSSRQKAVVWVGLRVWEDNKQAAECEWAFVK